MHEFVPSKMFLSCIVLFLQYAIVEARYNVTEEEAFKIKFGCLPQADWNLLDHKNKIIENVCITRDYKSHYPPRGLDYFNPIICQLRNTKVRDVDETKRTVTINFVVWFAWEDHRIKADFGKNGDAVGLPPITTEYPDLIWTPYATMNVQKLHKIKYILDPVITSRLLLQTGISANEIFRLNWFSPNATVVRAKLEWVITVACNFNFSKFPFDHNICPIVISVFNMNLTLQARPPKRYPNHEEAEGFDVIQTLHIDNKPTRFRNQKIHKFTFGVYIDMKREFFKYLLQYYLPCITIVIASSISFIIPLSAIPGRVALVVTLFLTLTNIFIHQMVS